MGEDYSFMKTGLSNSEYEEKVVDALEFDMMSLFMKLVSVATEHAGTYCTHHGRCTVHSVDIVKSLRHQAMVFMSEMTDDTLDQARQEMLECLHDDGETESQTSDDSWHIDTGSQTSQDDVGPMVEEHGCIAKDHESQQAGQQSETQSGTQSGTQFVSETESESESETKSQSDQRRLETIHREDTFAPDTKTCDCALCSGIDTCCSEWATYDPDDVVLQFLKLQVDRATRVVPDHRLYMLQ